MRVPPDNAGVAQLVEQGFCKPQVRGSIPCAGTRSEKGAFMAPFAIWNGAESARSWLVTVCHWPDKTFLAPSTLWLDLVPLSLCQEKKAR